MAALAQTSVQIDTQHDDLVHDTALNYYGTTLATASSDRTVRIYEVGATYVHTGSITCHTGPVWEVSWSHPKYGTLLASCSFDGLACIHRESPSRTWNTIHSHCMKEEERSSINSVQWAPHEFGLHLAAGSANGTVSILTHLSDDSWEAASFLDSPLGTNAVRWAPYKGVSIMELVTGGCDNKVRVWMNGDGNWSCNQNILNPNGPTHTDWVRDVAWRPVNSGVDVIASGSEDNKVIIWSREGESWSTTVLKDFGEPVWRVSWSVTGNILAVSSGDDHVSLWKESDNGWIEVSDVKEEQQAGGGEN
ncbi:hypothetical protein TrLO_g15557 [Triparma laevis f. longispina]|uniref:Protein transport protein SEC13 n=1 Tax=Triparma laevis f. longispina TaxID=1714387 RepID=A0A9W7AIJ6_9STRA|nr:hypothetical protein TrLO_g15557 [Triparma laevis f. longispina]